MKITSPIDLLRELDFELLDELLHRQRRIHKAIAYLEPFGNVASVDQAPAKDTHVSNATSLLQESSENSTRSDILSGRVQRLGDFIDTDAVSLRFNSHVLANGHSLPLLSRSLYVRLMKNMGNTV